MSKHCYVCRRVYRRTCVGVVLVDLLEDVSYTPQKVYNLICSPLESNLYLEAYFHRLHRGSCTGQQGEEHQPIKCCGSGCEESIVFPRQVHIHRGPYCVTTKRAAVFFASMSHRPLLISQNCVRQIDIRISCEYLMRKPEKFLLGDAGPVRKSARPRATPCTQGI